MGPRAHSVRSDFHNSSRLLAVFVACVSRGHSSAIIPADTAAAMRNCDRRVNQTSMIPELAPILELNTMMQALRATTIRAPTGSPRVMRQPAMSDAASITSVNVAREGFRTIARINTILKIPPAKLAFTYPSACLRLALTSRLATIMTVATSAGRPETLPNMRYISINGARIAVASTAPRNASAGCRGTGLGGGFRRRELRP